MWKNRCILTIIIILLFLPCVCAQSEKGVFPLKEILVQISTQHEVKFNFIEDEIVVFAFIPPPQDWTLADKINYIKDKTKLKITIIDQKYYTLYNDHKVDKPLCGYLIDQETNSPIENASVQILNTSTIASTNERGYFELPIVSPNNIAFRHQSYTSKEIEVKDLYVGRCPIIQLNSFSVELIEVITNRFLTTGISKKKDGSIEIKPKKFGLLPGLIEPDVLQTLQQIPGISSTDETISNLNVRGGTHDQNLFLWNGIRMFQTGHFFGLISAFNPSLAHTISVTKNGSSAFFGESVSSLVAISTHSKSIEETKSSISSNLISSEFYSKVKVSKKASVEVSGRRSLTDFFSSPTYRNYSDRVFQNTIITDLTNTITEPVRSKENFNFYDLTLQYQQKIGKKHEFWIDGIAVRNNLKIDQTRNVIQKNSSLSQENIGGAFRWKTTWNDNNSSQVDVSSSYYHLDATNEAIQSNQIFVQSNTVMDLGFQLKNTHKLSKKITFNVGYQFDEIGVTNSDQINTPLFSRNIKEVSITHTGISELQFQTNDARTFFNFGARLNYFEKFNSVILEPRLQFHQSISNTVSFEVLAEAKSQTLSQIIDLQQDFLGIEKRRWTLANDGAIPIQRSNQCSVGLTYKDNKWLVTWDNFYKKVNGITSSSQGFQNQFEFSRSIGSYEVIGTELLLQRNFKKLQAWLSYSFNDNKYLFKDLSTSDFPNNFELAHVLSAAMVYDWQQFKLAIGGKWHSGKPITNTASNKINLANPSSPQIAYDLPNNSNLPDYFQLNFSALRDWKISSAVSLQGGFSILNLLNKSNIIQKYYRVNSTQDGIETVNTYSLKRTPNLNLKLSF